MRHLAIAAALALAAGAAAAQPATTALPRALEGYSQPDITPGLCRTVSATETQCIIPQNTAGPYQITATGTSTATAANAVQRVVIRIGPTSICSNAQSPPNAAWAANTKKTLTVTCVAYMLTDATLTVSALYADANATKDPKGPTLTIKRVPWPGVLSVEPGQAQQQ